MAPLCFGGSQEVGIRPGTVAVPHAVGLATALSLKLDALNQTHQHLTVLTAWLMEQLQTLFGERCVMNTPLEPNNRVAGIVNASFPPYLGEQLVLQLDIRGIAVSSGSACHAGLAVEPSAVLLAMGKPKAIAQSSVRVSMGATTTQADLQAFLSAMQSIIKLPVRSVETI
ncbi:MAG: aminotransferase class V-fold PLP-dependent enzyme [Candidatus Melainabacteria bacterium]|nr:aminotransferase class V-fold PLP-dependent enzyme [Candidatus Melainabacteria bacterium]